MKCRLNTTHPDPTTTLQDPRILLTTALLDPRITTVLLLQLGILPLGVVWIAGTSRIVEHIDREVFKHF